MDIVACERGLIEILFLVYFNMGKTSDFKKKKKRRAFAMRPPTSIPPILFGVALGPRSDPSRGLGRRSRDYNHYWGLRTIECHNSNVVAPSTTVRMNMGTINPCKWLLYRSINHTVS